MGFRIDAGGPVDRDLPILTVRAADGRLRGVLVGYTCHAITLEGKDNFIHGDWPGAAKERRHPGTIAMITLGRGADANPNPRGGGLADAERNAREIADEVDRRCDRSRVCPLVARAGSISRLRASRREESLQSTRGEQGRRASSRDR